MQHIVFYNVLTDKLEVRPEIQALPVLARVEAVLPSPFQVLDYVANHEQTLDSAEDYLLRCGQFNCRHPEDAVRVYVQKVISPVLAMGANG
jgi:hypothetical protein